MFDQVLKVMSPFFVDKPYGAFVMLVLIFVWALRGLPDVYGWLEPRTLDHRISLIVEQLQHQERLSPEMVKLLTERHEEYLFEKLTGIGDTTAPFRRALISLVGQGRQDCSWRQIREARRYLRLSAAEEHLLCEVSRGDRLVAWLAAIVGWLVYLYLAAYFVIFLFGFSDIAASKGLLVANLRRVTGVIFLIAGLVYGSRMSRGVRAIRSAEKIAAHCQSVHVLDVATARLGPESEP